MNEMNTLNVFSIYYANIIHGICFFQQVSGTSKTQTEINTSRAQQGPVFPPAMGDWDIGTWPG